MKKKVRKSTAKSRSRVCNRCGYENALGARECAKCRSTRFAPDWVVAKRVVNRQVAVEVTRPNPEFGNALRLTLSKWWPGGRATFHIPNIAQWEAIASIISGDLLPMLGWKSKGRLVTAVAAGETQGRSARKEIRQLAENYPEVLGEIAKAINPEIVSREDLPNLISIVRKLSEASRGLNAAFRATFLEVVEKLPSQPKKALLELGELLGTWSLAQITAVTQQVKERLDTIELFKRQINDDRTYEIRGATSIHRILEGAMWLVDERYWLLHSNETLRKSIGDALSKQDKERYGDIRPDFVCGTIDNKLIILEIKRPAHTLTVADLNQLETYFTLAETYSQAKSYEGYLIGKSIDADLQRRMKHRSAHFKIWTYSDLLVDTEKRYKAYLAKQV